LSAKVVILLLNAKFLLRFFLFDSVAIVSVSVSAVPNVSIAILVPEEVLSLGILLLRCLCRVDGLHGVGVEACVPHLGGYGHGGGGEVLHLFQTVSHAAGDVCQLGHVLFAASWVRRYEIGYELLVQVLFAADGVELALEVVEELERGLPHELQYVVAGMLWSHFKPSADMLRDELAGVLPCSPVGVFVFRVVQQQVIAHAAANEALLDARQTVDGVVDVEQP